MVCMYADSVCCINSLPALLQDDKDLVHEFVIAEGLTCLIKVGAEADQNYQNYILRGIDSSTFLLATIRHCIASRNSEINVQYI